MGELAHAPRQTLAARHTFERELGRGGPAGACLAGRLSDGTA